MEVEIRNQCREVTRNLFSSFSFSPHYTFSLFFFPVRDRKVFLCFAVLGWNMAENTLVQPPGPNSPRKGIALIQLPLALTLGSITMVWITPMWGK